MFSKKDIDSFILKEASMYLSEDAEADNVSSIEDAIVLAKETLQKTKESLKNLTEKLKTDKQVQTSAVGADYKKMADAQVKITQDQLDLTKELVSSAENSLSDLESQKQQAIEDQKNSAVTEQESLDANKVESPIKKQEPEPKKKDMIVRFDTKSNSPFLVKFTDRGFLVGDTRLSFSLIQKAISKQFSLTLKNGLILTPVKMQKILKYKNRV
tara:strand:- start:138 stop:776 length:639 start_codon:yes stop_codon:yes gene_type:complete